MQKITTECCLVNLNFVNILMIKNIARFIKRLRNEFCKF